jgi:hypothetical protein
VRIESNARGRWTSQRDVATEKKQDADAQQRVPTITTALAPHGYSISSNALKLQPAQMTKIRSAARIKSNAGQISRWLLFCGADESFCQQAR